MLSKSLKFQIKNSITDIDTLRSKITNENIIIDKDYKNLKLRITPYYLNVINNSTSNLWQTVVPSFKENIITDDELLDPLHEDEQSPCHNITHRYENRVLFLVSDWCSVNCRFCTRSRMINNDAKTNLEAGFEYIKNAAFLPCLLSFLYF